MQSWPNLPNSPNLYLLTQNQIESRNLMGQVNDQISVDENLIHFDLGYESQFLLNNGSHIKLGQDLIFESYDGNIESMFYEPLAQSVYLNIPSQKIMKRIQLKSRHKDDFVLRGLSKYSCAITVFELQ